MRVLGYLALAALITVVAEIAAFVAAVKLIGAGWAILAVLALMALGGWALRREGRSSWRRFRDAAAQGRVPGREATDGLVGLIGALLLAAPGFVTGAVGALLLAPPIRRYASNRIERSAERFISPAAAGTFFGPRRVRVYRGPGVPTPPAGTPPPAQQWRPAVEALEGEIIEADPTHRRGEPGP